MCKNIEIKMYTLYNNMYTIQIIYYVMFLYNITEIKYNDVVLITKQLNKIKDVTRK